jgi:hypothetical protein
MGCYLLHGLRLFLRILGGLQFEKREQIFDGKSPMGLPFQDS